MSADRWPRTMNPPKSKEESMRLLAGDDMRGSTNASGMKSASFMVSPEEESSNVPRWAACVTGCGRCCGFFCIFASCGCCCNPYKTVDAGSRGVVTQFGRVRSVEDPGMVYVNPLSEKIIMVNVRNQVKSLRSQEVMTLDQLPVTIEGDVFYRRVDPVKSQLYVQNVDQAIDLVAQNCLRGVFGRYTLEDCLAHRSEISDETMRLAADFCKDFGVEITSIQIKDLRLPQHIRNMLASTATAEREGKAMIITAEANVKSAQLMRQAADVLSTDAAMQIRQLEVVERLAMNPNSKLVFLPGMLDGARPGPSININTASSGADFNPNFPQAAASDY